MIFSYKINSKRINMKLQSRLDFCNLQSGCKQIFSLNNNLHKFLDCKMQTADEVCNLGENRFKSITYTTNLDCTVNYSPYGRGAPFGVALSPCKQIFSAVDSTEQLINCNEIYADTILGSNSIKSAQQYFCAAEKTNYHCLSADKITYPSTLGSELNSRPAQNFCGVDKIKYRSPLAEHAVDSKATSLCLDLGTTTGWAAVENKKIAQSGSASFRYSRFQGGGIRFLKFINFLDELLTTTHMQIRLVFFEEVRRHLGVDAAHAYGGFVAQLTAWCEQHSIAYEGVPVGTIKRHATGRGNASKAQVIESIRARGHQPVDDNEADALALAYWAIDNRLRG